MFEDVFMAILLSRFVWAMVGNHYEKYFEFGPAIQKTFSWHFIHQSRFVWAMVQGIMRNILNLGQQFRYSLKLLFFVVFLWGCFAFGHFVWKNGTGWEALVGLMRNN